MIHGESKCQQNSFTQSEWHRPHTFYIMDASNRCSHNVVAICIVVGKRPTSQIPLKCSNVNRHCCERQIRSTKRMASHLIITHHGCLRIVARIWFTIWIGLKQPNTSQHISCIWNSRNNSPACLSKICMISAHPTHSRKQASFALRESRTHAQTKILLATHEIVKQT